MLVPIVMMLSLFCINNARRAKLKNLNPVVWISLTVLLFFVGMFVATFLLLVILIYKYPTLLTLAETNDKIGINKFVLAQFTEHDVLYPALMFAGAFGGYLLVRYLIEKKK